MSSQKHLSNCLVTFNFVNWVKISNLKAAGHTLVGYKKV